MQDKDPLAPGYNFDQISSDAVREQGRRDSVTALDEAYNNTNTETPLLDNPELENILRSVAVMDKAVSDQLIIADMNDAYDSFERNGITIESRIIRLEAAGPHSPNRHGNHRARAIAALSLDDRRHPAHETNTSTIFLLAALGEGQKTIGKENVTYGAVQKPDGQTEFFKLVPRDEADEADSYEPMRGPFSIFGIPDSEDDLEDSRVAQKLDGVEEQALINEFAKATKTFAASAAERGPEELHPIIKQQLLERERVIDLSLISVPAMRQFMASMRRDPVSDNLPKPKDQDRPE